MNIYTTTPEEFERIAAATGARVMGGLGAATEILFRIGFANSATINLKTASALIGVSEKTLRKMTDDGLIRAVRRGQCRSYTEADLRAYLTEGPDVCPRDKKPSSTVRSDKIVPFSRRRR